MVIAKALSYPQIILRNECYIYFICDMGIAKANANFVQRLHSWLIAQSYLLTSTLQDSADMIALI